MLMTFQYILIRSTSVSSFELDACRNTSCFVAQVSKSAATSWLETKFFPPTSAVSRNASNALTTDFVSSHDLLCWYRLVRSIKRSTWSRMLGLLLLLPLILFVACCAPSSRAFHHRFDLGVCISRSCTRGLHLLRFMAVAEREPKQFIDNRI